MVERPEHSDDSEVIKDPFYSYGIHIKEATRWKECGQTERLQAKTSV